MPAALSACGWRLRAGVAAALRTIASLAYEMSPRILITGSLYLAGEVLAQRHVAD